MPPRHPESSDHRQSLVDQATTQAAFVFVYELVRTALHVERDRLIRVSLKDENAGDRIVLTTKSTDFPTDSSRVVWIDETQAGEIVRCERTVART